MPTFDIYSSVSEEESKICDILEVSTKVSTQNVEKRNTPKHFYRNFDSFRPICDLEDHQEIHELANAVDLAPIEVSAEQSQNEVPAEQN